MLVVTTKLIGQSSVYKTVILPADIHGEKTVIKDGITTRYYDKLMPSYINGSPYLNDDFMFGQFALKDGRRVEKTKFRYNIYYDTFEMLYKNDTLIISKPYNLKWLTLNDKTYIYTTLLPEGSKVKNGYFEVLAKGQLSLYLKRTIKVEYDEFLPNYKGGGGTKEFYYERDISYYVEDNNNYVFVLTSKRRFLKNIPDHKSEIKKFMKQNKTKIREESSVVQLINYYNSFLPPD